MSVPKHHAKDEVCSSRATYREGRKAKAVKVFTVNQESQYLLVQGVPSVGATSELIKLFSQHGTVQEHRPLDDYPAESYTDVYLIKFKKIVSARFAKRKLDDWSFFGGVLHVCYAPEYETVQETREKLQDRRKSIATKTRQFYQDGTYSSIQHQTQSADHHPRQQAVHPGTSIMSGSQTSSSQNKPSSTRNYEQTSLENGSRSVDNQDRDAMSMTGSSSTNANTLYYGQVGHSQSHVRNHQRAPPFVRQGQMSNQTHRPDLRHNIHQPGLPGNHTPIVSETQHGFEGHAEDMQISLPPPPRPGHRYPISVQSGSWDTDKSSKFNYARVPTANAVFPEGFDARLDKTETSASSPLRPESPEELDDNDDDEVVNIKSKTMQEKIEENLKNKSSVVIKTFETKPKSVPRFIPRQAQPKSKQSGSLSKGETGKEKSNMLNEKLKKDAFTLKDVQGPSQPDGEKRPKVDSVEVSVNKSVKDIRKRIKQLTEEAISNSKKTKLDVT